MLGVGAASVPGLFADLGVEVDGGERGRMDEAPPIIINPSSTLSGVSSPRSSERVFASPTGFLLNRTFIFETGMLASSETRFLSSRTEIELGCWTSTDRVGFLGEVRVMLSLSVEAVARLRFFSGGRLECGRIYW